MDNGAELGSTSNQIVLLNNLATVDNGFRATGAFSLNHVIKLGAGPANAIEVSATNPIAGRRPGLVLGAVPTASTPFTLTLNDGLCPQRDRRCLGKE